MSLIPFFPCLNFPSSTEEARNSKSFQDYLTRVATSSKKGTTSEEESDKTTATPQIVPSDEFMYKYAEFIYNSNQGFTFLGLPCHTQEEERAVCQFHKHGYDAPDFTKKVFVWENQIKTASICFIDNGKRLDVYPLSESIWTNRQHFSYKKKTHLSGCKSQVAKSIIFPLTDNGRLCAEICFQKPVGICVLIKCAEIFLGLTMTKKYFDFAKKHSIFYFTAFDPENKVQRSKLLIGKNAIIGIYLSRTGNVTLDFE